MENKGLLQIALHGEATRKGEIDVAYFAPLLTAINRLLQSANAEIYNKDSKITVKLRATKKGSFLADFVVARIHDISLFPTEPNQEIAAINQLLDMLLKLKELAGVPVGGVFALLLWLKGHKPTKEEHKDGKIYIHNGDKYFITSPESFKLSQNPKICKEIKK